MPFVLVAKLLLAVLVAFGRWPQPGNLPRLDLLRKHLLGTRANRTRRRPGRRVTAPAPLVRNPGGCDP